VKLQWQVSLGIVNDLERRFAAQSCRFGNAGFETAQDSGRLCQTRHFRRSFCPGRSGAVLSHRTWHALFSDMAFGVTVGMLRILNQYPAPGRHRHF
jgi:hypothetical protein